MEGYDVQIKPEQAAVSTLPRTLSDAYRNRMGELLDLTESQKRRLCGWLKKRLAEWSEDTAELHRILEEDNDLVEGVVPETDYPFPGASNVHVDVTGIYMDIFQSIEKRSILGAGSIWHAESDAEELWDLTAKVETLMNQKAQGEWNIAEAIPMAIWAKNRDGLCAVKITWEEDYEHVNDLLVITSEEEFLGHFPNAEEAGITPEDWAELRTYIVSHASNGTPVEIPIKFEKRTYYGNRAHVVEYIDFVVIPATAPTIYGPACRGYGMRFHERKEEIREKIREKVYYDDEAKKLLKKGGSDESVSSFVKAQDWVEGLKRTNTKDDFEEFELVVKGRLDGEDGDDGKYLVTYNKTHNILLRAIEFPYRLDNYALFVVNKRPNRLGGKSIPRKTRDMNDEIDTQHNQRINARTISSVPSFKAHPDIKKEWDPEAPHNRWKPGYVLWTTMPDKVDQFKIQPTDLGESMAEESNDFRILDLSLGAPASLFSGHAPGSDPDAPGNKTAMLISQGNMRMDDTLMEDREGIAKMGEICLSHLYQFGPPMLEFVDEQLAEGGVTKRIDTVHKKFLRTGIKMRMSGLTVVQNPEAEMAKRFQVHQFLLTSEPLFAQNAKYRVESLRDALRAGREPGRDRYLPPLEEIERQEVELRKRAMVEMELEKKAQEMKARDELIKQNLAKARQDLQIRKTAEDLANANLGESQQNGGPVNA